MDVLLWWWKHSLHWSSTSYVISGHLPRRISRVPGFDTHQSTHTCIYIYISFFLFTTFLVQFKRFVPAKVNANGQAKLLFNLNEVDNSTAVIGTQHWSNSPIAMGFLGGGNSNIWFFTAKIGGNDPIWLIFFRWIETTNHLFQLTWTRMSDLANKFWILRVPGRLDTVDGRNLAWA